MLDDYKRNDNHEKQLFRKEYGSSISGKNNTRSLTKTNDKYKSR